VADSSFARSYSVGGHLRLRAHVEAFSLLNRTDLALPNRILGLETSGVLNHTSTSARQIQFGPRLEW
jgi:hypothetical protein